MPTYEEVTTPSIELAKELRESLDEWGDSHPDSKASCVLHYRGGQEEFDLGTNYSKSGDPLDRVAGAVILAQLGYSKGLTYLTESVDLLIGLLKDQDQRVVINAAFALGHRGDPRAVPHLVKLVDHPNEDVRYSVVFGLLTQEAPEAISSLIKLSRDPDPDVRDWAVFGLGSQLDEVDTPELREALFAALSDENPDVVGEAMVGLAEREDFRVVPALLKCFEDERPYGLTLEAAFLIGDPLLLPALEKLQTEMDGEKGDDWVEAPTELEAKHWRKDLQDALRRCRGEIDRYREPLGPDGLPVEEPDPG